MASVVSAPPPARCRLIRSVHPTTKSLPMFRSNIASAFMLLVSSALIAQMVPPLPKDADTLRKAYQDARQRALQPLDLKYKTELEKLLAAHTKAGHLDDALAIRAELDSLSPTAQPDAPASDPQKFPSAKAERIHTELVGSMWSTTNWNDATITLMPDGKVSFTKGGHELYWSISKAGELELSDRGAAPRKATLSLRRDSFTINMGAEHVCNRLDTPKKP